MTTETRDLTVNGPGSPYSFDKVLTEVNEKKETNELMVFIENEGNGFLNDVGAHEINSKECLEQAEYFRAQYVGKMPPYLYRYLQFFFDDGYEMKYPTDKSFVDAINSGMLTQQSDEFKMIDNMIRYSNANNEAAHIIGFITLLVGTLTLMKKSGQFGRIYLAYPEAGLHPKRERKVMLVLSKIREEYGGTVSGMSI